MRVVPLQNPNSKEKNLMIFFKLCNQPLIRILN